MNSTQLVLERLRILLRRQPGNRWSQHPQRGLGTGGPDVTESGGARQTTSDANVATIWLQLQGVSCAARADMGGEFPFSYNILR